jgi:hypothetical protein
MEEPWLPAVKVDKLYNFGGHDMDKDSFIAP